MHTFEYSVLKYMPDPKRGEIVNVGILVFLNDKIDLRLLNSAAKLRLIDGDSSIFDIQSYKESLESLLSFLPSGSDAFEMLSTIHGATYLSEKACFCLDHINQYEAQVQRLFNDLVKPYSIREIHPRVSRIHTTIKHRFESMDLLAKGAEDLSRHKVVYNFPINEKSGFSADFLLKNGRYHITEAIDFNVNDVNSKFKETTMKVMAFVEGKKFLGEESACYFLYSASIEKEKDILSHLNLASDYSDKVFNLESREEEARYFNLIAELAGRDMPNFH